MAGTIVADDLKHSNNDTVGTEYIINGSLKAWGACNDAGASRDSGTLNVSSVTDNGANGKVFNYSSVFAARAMSGIGQDLVGARGNTSGFNWATASGTTASKITCQYYNGSAYVDQSASFISTGDLA